MQRTGDNRRNRRTTLFVVVALLHAVLFWWMAMVSPPQTFPPQPSLIFIDMIPGNPFAGGSAAPRGTTNAVVTPTAPSSLHRPAEIHPVPETLPVPPPPTPAEQQTEITFTPTPAPTAAPTTADGGAGVRAGQGAGDGTGTGSGSGNTAGIGGDSPARWLRELTPAERDAYYPRQARRDGIAGRVVLSCTVYRSTRLERCRVVSETPRRAGFGDAALQAVKLMRARPPVVDGQILRVHRMEFVINFTPPAGSGEPGTR